MANQFVTTTNNATSLSSGDMYNQSSRNIQLDGDPEDEATGDKS